MNVICHHHPGIQFIQPPFRHTGDQDLADALRHVRSLQPLWAADSAVQLSIERNKLLPCRKRLARMWGGAMRCLREGTKEPPSHEELRPCGLPMGKAASMNRHNELVGHAEGKYLYKAAHGAAPL